MSTRIAKKSTSTRKQVVRRNGQRESKTEIVIEEEEDVNDSENESENGVPAEGGDSQQMSEGQSQSQSQSQSQGDNQLEKMITDMMQTQRKRVSVAKSTIHKSYDKSVSDIKNSIDTLFDNHEAESAQVHATHLKRLQQLLAKKADVEAEMQTKLASLRQAYHSHALGLQTVVLDRARQLN